MTIAADESVDGLTVEYLRAAGHRVLFIAELEPGIKDREVLRRALEMDAVLVTADKDFGELVFRQGLPHSGVVLIRLAGLPLEEGRACDALFLRVRRRIAGALCGLGRAGNPAAQACQVRQSASP